MQLSAIDRWGKNRHWIIDEIRRTLPVWKTELFTEVSHEWVRCDRCAQGHHHHLDG